MGDHSHHGNERAKFIIMSMLQGLVDGLASVNPLLWPGEERRTHIIIGINRCAG